MHDKFLQLIRLSAKGNIDISPQFKYKIFLNAIDPLGFDYPLTCINGNIVRFGNTDYDQNNELQRK